MFSRAVRRPNAWRLATASGLFEREGVALDHFLQV